MRPRALITGIGLISPLGLTTQTTWFSLLSSQSAIKPYFHHPQIPVEIAASIPRESLPSTPPYLSPCPDFAKFALLASNLAFQDANLLPHSFNPNLAGVSIGVGIAHIPDIEIVSTHLSNNKYRRISPYAVPRTLPNTPAGLVSLHHNLRGPTLTPATACAAGAHALGDAYHAIQRSDVDIMIAGGSEAALHPVTIAGFARAQALSIQEPAKPFDITRSGFVVGEGAAVLIVENELHARARGVKAYAEVVGFGASGDAYHVTAPPSDGDGALRAMRKAVKDSGFKKEQVHYINAHATGTNIGDLVERRAIANLLPVNDVGDKCVVSSTKGGTGHLLGAAGAMETAFAALAVAQDVVPPTLFLNSLDKDEEIEQLGWGDVNRYIPNVKKEMKIELALSNSFGFGGTNACVAVAKAPEDMRRNIING